MSFLRSLFESKPAETDSEYVIRLIKEINEGKIFPITIFRLKELSHEFSSEISKSAIPALVKAYTQFINNDEVVNDLITIFAELLRNENEKKSENASSILDCENSIHNFVKTLDDKNTNLRVSAMHILMMIANLQPEKFQQVLTENQPQMIRLFGSISDQNASISSKFVSNLPALIHNNPDFQQIVGFNMLDSLVKNINRERPEFLNAIIAIVYNNPINQSLFLNTGYLNAIQDMFKTPDQNILNLLEKLINPNDLTSFQKVLETTQIVIYLCDNIIRGNLRQSNIHVLAICIKGSQEITDQISEKIDDFIRIFLSTNCDFYELFQNYVFESNKNTLILNEKIILYNENNKITSKFIDLCSFSILTSPNYKSNFINIFNSLISNLNLFIVDFKLHRETSPEILDDSFQKSMLNFFSCFCWESKEYCEILNQNIPSLIQLQINDNTSKEAKDILLIIFGEILLFSKKNKTQIGVLTTSISPIELVSNLNEIQLTNNSNENLSAFDIFNFQRNTLHYIIKNKDKLNDGNDDSLYFIENNKNIQTIEQLNNQLVKEKEELSHAYEEINNLKIILQQTEANIKNEEKDNIKLIKENSDTFDSNLVLELESKDSIIKEINIEKLNLQNELNEMKITIANLNESNKNNENIINKLSKENSEKDTIIKNLQSENASIQTQLQSFQDEINLLNSNLEETYQKLNDKNNSLLALKADNEQLMNKIEQQSIETTEMVERFNKEIQNLTNSQNKNPDELIQSLYEQIESLSNENKEQLSIIRQNDNNKINQEQTISLLKEENESFRQKINAMETDNESEKSFYKDKISLLEKEIFDLKGTSQINDTKLNSDEIEELNSKLKSTQSEFNNYKINAEKQIQQRESQINTLINQNHEQLTLIEQLKNEISIKSSQNSHDILAQKLHKTNEDLNSQVSIMNSQIQELQQIAQSKSFSMNQSEISNADPYNQSHDESMKDQDNLKAQIRYLNQQIEELQKSTCPLTKQKELEEIIEQLKVENSYLKNLESTNKNYEQLISKQRKLINDLKDQNEKLEAANLLSMSLSSDNEEHKTNSKHEKKSHKETNLQVENLQNIIQETNSKYDQIKIKYNNLCKEKEMLNEKLNQYQKNTSSDDIVSLRKQILDLQTIISTLKTENSQLKNSPDKALVSVLKGEKENLELLVDHLRSEVRDLQKLQNKNIPGNSYDSISNESIKLMQEIELLKRENENQSHTISDLQILLNSSNRILNPVHDTDFYPNKFDGFTEYNNLSLENEILNSQLKEYKAMESENARLNQENMELKMMVRQSSPHKPPPTSKFSYPKYNSSLDNANTYSIPKPEFPSNYSLSTSFSTTSKFPDDDHKKALRLIGKLWLDQHQ